MAVPVEEAIAALSTFSLEDDQPDFQGLNILLSTERQATVSPIEYADVSANRLSLVEDTKAINQLNSLIVEGKEMSAVLYTYRSCVKALPQLPESMKQSQVDLYLETYQVLDLEMSRLREIQRWQLSAASKLAADMQRFSRPERRINGPSTTHIWSILKLLDVLVALDHLKNAKVASWGYGISNVYDIYMPCSLGYLEEYSQETLNKSEVLGDSVAWGGCTIIYLLGQQMHFELFDFSYQLLNVAEVESVAVAHFTSSERAKNASYLQGWYKLIEGAKKARRLNNHVFSMLKARCPLEEKMACAIKQSGAPLHSVKYENTISAFETLPQKGA